jgi:hypothetical protein
MPTWLKRLAGRDRGSSALALREALPKSPTFKAEIAPAFETRLAVESPGSPGRAGAEALYQRWAARWQEF